MKAITADASDDIRRDILEQIRALDEKRQAFKPPWGLRSSNRMIRLMGKRLRIYYAQLQQEINRDRTENAAIRG